MTSDTGLEGRDGMTDIYLISSVFMIMILTVLLVKFCKDDGLKQTGKT